MEKLILIRLKLIPLLVTLILLTACATPFPTHEKIHFSLGTKKTNLLNTVKSCINSCHRKGIFILDTASSAIVINSKSTMAHGLMGKETKKVPTGVGTTNVAVAYLNKFKMSGLHIPFPNPFPIYLSDLSSLKKSVGRDIDGVIGLNVLKYFGVDFNYSSGTGTLYLNERVKPNSLGYKQLKLNGRLNLKKFKINGVTLRNVAIDIGSTDMALTKSYLSRIAGRCKIKQTHFAIAGGTATGTERKCNTITVFGKTYHNVMFAIGTSNEVGMSFISKNDFIIDYPNKNIYYRKLPQ